MTQSHGLELMVPVTCAQGCSSCHWVLYSLWWAQPHVLLGMLVQTSEVMLIFQLNFATRISPEEKKTRNPENQLLESKFWLSR